MTPEEELEVRRGIHAFFEARCNRIAEKYVDQRNPDAAMAAFECAHGENQAKDFLTLTNVIRTREWRLREENSEAKYLAEARSLLAQAETE